MNGNISIDSVFAACNDAEQALNEDKKQIACGSMRTAIDILTKYLLLNKTDLANENDLSGMDLQTRINILSQKGVISINERNLLDAVRKAGNYAVHEGTTNETADGLKRRIEGIRNIAAKASANQGTNSEKHTGKYASLIDQNFISTYKGKYFVDYYVSLADALDSNSISQIVADSKLLNKSIIEGITNSYNFVNPSEGRNMQEETILLAMMNNGILSPEHAKLLNHINELLSAGERGELFVKEAEKLLCETPYMINEEYEFVKKNPGVNNIYVEPKMGSLAYQGASFYYTLLVVGIIIATFFFILGIVFRTALAIIFGGLADFIFIKLIKKVKSINPNAHYLE